MTYARDRQLVPALSAGLCGLIPLALLVYAAVLASQGLL